MTTLSNQKFLESAVFSTVDVSKQSMRDQEFYQCIFKHCRFDEARLLKCKFDTCSFIHCSFSMATLTDSSFNSCNFDHCALVGVDFTKMTAPLTFEPVFSNCNLGFSVFSGQKMQKSKFLSCNLEEVDFSDAKMDDTDFKYSDLTRATFNHSDLRGCDFRGAHNYTIDPRNNYIKGAKFSEPEVSSLLEPLQILVEDPPELVNE